MSNYAFPTKGALRFQYGPWSIGLWLNEDIGIGSPFILGYDDVGTGWLAVAIIDGPYDAGTWQQIITAAGGMGNYAVSKMPQIKALLKEHFDTNPPLPVETNATPFTVQDFNNVWAEYFTIQPVSGATYPTINRK